MSIIKCPKCNSNMIDECCVKFGYMTNGNVSGGFVLEDKNEDLKLYNKDFEKMNMNENKFLVFIFKSSYMAYRDHFWFSILLSLICSIIDILIIRFHYFIIIEVLSVINSYLEILFLFVVLLHFFIQRMIYTMFANIICLKLDKFKIKKLKDKNDNYKVILRNNKSTSLLSLCTSIFINFIILVISGIAFILTLN